MDEDSVRELYDADYAAAYDAQFMDNPECAGVVEFELFLLSELLAVHEGWLDAACGTGWFLSRFPDQKRTGIDISPDMLALARERNPDAEFELGNLREDRTGWTGHFQLVSCMFGAYCYLDSVEEVDDLLRRLSDWTAPGGSLFLPVIAFEDLLYGRPDQPRENPDVQVVGGALKLEAIIWGYAYGEQRHTDLVAPHTDRMVDVLREQFETVEVVYYTPFPYPVSGQRVAILATTRKGAVPPPGLAAGLERIRERSRTNRLEVLGYAEAVAIEAAATSGGGEKSPAGPEGWLRRAWRRLPAPLQDRVRKLVGEG